MSFFNDLGKKISQTSQDAVNKTKAMTETTKLNGAINDCKRKIELAYKEVGRFYCEKYMDDPNPEIAEQVNLVKQLNEKIEELQMEIRRINGFGTCPNCGQIVKPGALFCTNCGMKFESPEPPVQKNNNVCANCGNPVAEDAAFCTNCGTPVNKQNQPPINENEPPYQNDELKGKYYWYVPSDENGGGDKKDLSGDNTYTSTYDYSEKPEADEPELNQEKDVKICPSCGYECSSNSMFCLRCGEKF